MKTEDDNLFFKKCVCFRATISIRKVNTCFLITKTKHKGQIFNASTCKLRFRTLYWDINLCVLRPSKNGGRTIYHTLHVFNVLSTFKHYFTQNMTLSSVNTYNFHSNVKEIKKISVNQLFRQRVTASMIFIHRDNPKLLSDHVLTLFRRCDFLPKYTQIQLQIILFLLKANYIIFLNFWS